MYVSEGLGTESALVPFGDMLNHCPHPHLRHTRWTFVKNVNININDTASPATDVTANDTLSSTDKACTGWFTLTVVSESGLQLPGAGAGAGAGDGQQGGVQQEVFDSYGHKSNSRYLFNYGFTIPQNIITINNKSNGAGTAPANTTLRCFEDCRLFFQLDPQDPHLTLKVDPFSVFTSRHQCGLVFIL